MGTADEFEDTLLRIKAKKKKNWEIEMKKRK